MPVETDTKAVRAPEASDVADPKGGPSEDRNHGQVPKSLASEQDQTPPKFKNPSMVALGMSSLLAVSGILLVLYAWKLPPFATSMVTTNDAYVHGRVTVMATKVSGYVSEAFVEDYQSVKKGQALFRIDPQDYEQVVAQARGTLDASIANLENAAQMINTNRANLLFAQADLAAMQAEDERTKVDLARILDLASRGVVSTQNKDQARAASITSTANVQKSMASIRVADEAVRTAIVQRKGLAATVDSNRAVLEQAHITLSYTLISAPADGQLGPASVRTGQYVAAGSQIIYVVPKGFWVVANFKETQIWNLRVGQTGSVAVDALGGVRIAGRVEAISPATGAQFSVLKPDNASGNFTKVVQRIPVRILLEADDLNVPWLRAGMSVVARIDTNPATTVPARPAGAPDVFND